ncbi:putative agmatine deiminase [Arthrobacter sp. Hiyo4]|nr:putative agmatine deiminase [Arthrobacter sp. Hiyo4]
MPAETAPQERLWMAFPTGGYTLGDTEEDAHAARSVWAAVANAAVEFEPVTVVVDPDDVGIAARYLNRNVEVLAAPLNDAWMRDIGPTFVLDQDGSLGAVDWIFNGWGAQDWARWDKDALIAGEVSGRSGATHIVSALVNEGGGIQVDGQGTVLVTETVQLDPGRNPGLSRADVEAELARTIGATQVVWLPRGLARDSERFGTRGHVDIVAAIPSPGTLLVHSQQDPRHPDFQVSRDIIEHLRTTRDAAGREWTIIEVPALKCSGMAKALSTTATSTTSWSTAASSPVPSGTPTMTRRCRSWRRPTPAGVWSALTPVSSSPAAAESTASPNSSLLPRRKRWTMTQTTRTSTP